MSKTNLNLIVNGTKVYTRKTTGRPYTHALVGKWEDGSWSITNCSAKGEASLMDNDLRDWSGRKYPRGGNGCIRVTEWFVAPIIDNTVTVTA